MTTARLLRSALMTAALSAITPSVDAAPQVSAGVTGGYGVMRLRDDPTGAAHLGLRADALFLRNRSRDGAIGPYIEGLTVAFDDVQAGGGATFLVPGLDTVAFGGGAGLFARHSAAGWHPGVSAALFFGLRSHNFHSVYGMANGLFVEGRHGLGDSRQSEILFGARVDLAILAMPFLLLWGSLR